MAKDVYYFPHEATAHSDPKITKLLMALKAEGYGVYWVILEMLRNEENLMLTRNDYDAIAYQSHSNSITVARVVEDFGLFSIVSNGSFCSESLIRRVEAFREKSRKYAQNAHKRWENNAMVMQSHSNGNALKERKGKEIKEKKIRSVFIPPTLEEVKSYCLERKNGIDPQAFIDKNATIGWLDKNKIPYKDWKAVIRTWENYRKTNNIPNSPTVQAKRPVAIVVVEMMAKGLKDYDIKSALVGMYVEKEIDEAIMRARGKII